MVVEALVSTVLSVLLPYVAKGGEEFAKQAGKDAFEKAKSLLHTIRAKFAGDNEASEALTKFEEKPAHYESVLDDILREKLSKDRGLASELSRLLNDLGPQLEIIQKMRVGKDITGLKAEEMTGGRANIQQEIEQAEKVTGAEVKKIGRPPM